jgi:endonuclease/exonuclease/phosphatase (EEP) superfamily protein YafD
MRRMSEPAMRSALRFAAFLALLACGAARAQDVPGIELCTHETRMERRTGCLQSNIEYLHTLIAKNATAAQQKANATAGEIAALKAEVAALRGTLAELQARLERLEVAAKARPSPAGRPKSPR